LKLNDLVRLAPKDVSAAAAVLSRAFLGDPNFCGLICEEDKRKRMLARLMKYALREGVLFGESYVTSRQFEGIAVWHRPNVPISWFSRMFRVGVCWAPIDLGVGLTRKVLQCVDFLDDMRAKYAPAKHWHLQLLGVDPEHQGKGHAKRLVMPMLDQCDRDGISCFLDTQNSANVPIYERFGFTVVHQCVVPPANVDCWFLLRKPRA
jgi:ribosomal protein S18 acetylase RimI-like enzyme